MLGMAHKYAKTQRAQVVLRNKRSSNRETWELWISQKHGVILWVYNKKEGETKNDTDKPNKRKNESITKMQKGKK